MIDAKQFLSESIRRPGNTTPGRSSTEWLIKEYIEGELVSVESCIHRGAVRNFGITTCRLMGFLRFLEIGGCFSFDHSRQAELFDMNTRVLNVLDLAGKDSDYGFFHSEYLLAELGPPVVCEVNARLAGDILPKMFEAAIGINPAAEVIRQSLGEAPKIPVAGSKAAVGRVFGTSVDSGFASIIFDGIEKIPGYVEACSFKSLGIDIPRLSCSDFRCLGYVVYVGRHRDEAEERAEKALRKIRLTVDLPISF